MQMIVRLNCNLNGQLSEASITLQGDGQVNADVVVAGGATNLHVVESFKITDLTAGGLLLISTGEAMTVKTNSSSVPDDTFSVPAGGFVLVPSLSADITALYVTNGSPDTETTLQLRGVKDVTP